MYRYNNRVPDRDYLLPRDFFGWLLLIFAIGTMTLTGYGQLKLIGVLLAGSFSVYFLVKKLWLPQEMIILIAWVLWASSTGYLVSIDKESFLNSIKVVIQIMVMSFAVSGIVSKQCHVNTLFLGLIIGGIILFFSSFFTGEFISATAVEAQYQVKGLTSNPNDYGYSLLLSAAGLLYFLASNESRKKKIITYLLLAAFAYAIILSGSRKSFMGFIALITLWLFINYKKELLKKPSYIVILIIIIGGLYIASDYMLTNTWMGSRFERDFVEDPISGRSEDYHRLIFYKEGFEHIKNNPIFGIGVGNFASLSSLSKESHSDYIEVASSTGIIGFIMYFSIYFILWRRLNWIQKRVKDVSILREIGFFKAVIITILFLAVGRPNLTSQATWLVLSGIIGYTSALKKYYLFLLTSR